MVRFRAEEFVFVTMNAALGFIGSVAAVVVAIATPLFRHAVSIRAPEGRILLAADRSSSGADVGSFVEDASLAAIPLRGITLRRQIPFVVTAWANGADALLLRIRAVISAVLLVLACGEGGGGRGEGVGDGEGREVKEFWGKRMGR